MTRSAHDRLTEKRWHIMRDANAKTIAMEAEVQRDFYPGDIGEFANSPRGQALIARALSLAICALDKVPPHRRSPSDQADMKRMLFGLFPAWGPAAMEETLAQPKFDRLVARRGRR